MSWIAVGVGVTELRDFLHMPLSLRESGLVKAGLAAQVLVPWLLGHSGDVCAHVAHTPAVIHSCWMEINSCGLTTHGNEHRHSQQSLDSWPRPCFLMFIIVSLIHSLWLVK